MRHHNLGTASRLTDNLGISSLVMDSRRMDSRVMDSRVMEGIRRRDTLNQDMEVVDISSRNHKGLEEDLERPVVLRWDLVVG